jgi:hypothetical protein
MQLAIVILIVSAAALYAAWHLMPRGLRQSASTQVARLATHIGMKRERALDLGRRLSRTGGCSSCDDCGACAAPTSTAKGAAPAAQPIRIERRPHSGRSRGGSASA